MPMTTRATPVNMDDIVTGQKTDLTERERQITANNDNWREILAFSIPSIAIGALDTIAQSVTPDHVVGEETVENMVNSLSDPLGQFYANNKEAVQTIGDIGSAFVPMIGAAKLIRSEGYLDKALGNTKRGNMLRRYLISSGKTRKDFIDSIDQEAKLFVANKQLSMSETGTDTLSRALRNAKLTAAADMGKEMVAADLSLVLLYNESDVFFPDELSTLSNIALFAVPDLLLTGLAYRFTGQAIKKHLQSTYGHKQSETLNPFKGAKKKEQATAAATGEVSAPGRRGPMAAVEGLSANIAKKEQMSSASTAALRESGQQRTTAHQRNVMEQLILMGKDDVFKHGISSKVEFTPASPEMQNLLMQTQADPSLIAGVRSVQKVTPKAQTELPIAIEKRMEQLVADRKETLKALRKAEIDKADDKVKAELTDKLNVIKAELDDVTQVRSPIVAETDGSITPLDKRKWSILDEPEKLKAETKILTEGDTRIYSASTKLSNEVGAEIGVTDTGKILIKPVDKKLEGTALGGVNLTKVLSKDAATINAEATESMQIALKEMNSAWNFKTGSEGKQAFAKLAPELQADVKNWDATTGAKQMREWVASGDERYSDVMQAYREVGFQRRLSEVANADGTVTMFKAETAAETKSPVNDIVSMTIDAKVAASSAAKSKNLIKRNVPIEDIVMPIGSKTDKSQFIVKGNLRRNNSITGLKQEQAIQAQTFEQRMATYGLLQRSLNDYKPGVSPPVYVHGESTMLELDFATQLMKKFPGKTTVYDIVGGKSLPANFDALQHKLLRKQFNEVQKLKTIQNSSRVGLIKLKPAQTLSDYDIAKMSNLPNPTAGGPHPLQQALDEIMPMIGDPIRDLSNFYPSLSHIKAGMVKHTNQARLGEELIADMKLTGNSLTSNYNEKLAPSILLSTDNYMGRIGPDQLAERTLANKVWQDTMIQAEHAKPLDQQRAPLVSAITRQIFADPATLRLARHPDYIVEGTQANKGIAGQQVEVFNNNPVLLAADRVHDLAEKIAIAETTKIFKQESAIFSDLLSANNSASLDLMDIAINSIQQGWKLKPGTVKLTDDLVGFELDEAWAFNKQQYKDLFGVDFDEVMSVHGQVLMPVRASVKPLSGEVPTPVAVDALAGRGLEAVDRLENAWLNNFNFLRELNHQTPVPRKPWHIPAINLAEGYTVFLADGAGKFRGLVNRPTKAEALRVAQKEVDKAADAGLLWIRRSEEEAQQYFDVQGDIWADARNFSYAEFQTGSAKGKTGTSTIEFGKAPLNDLLRRMQKNYEILTKRTFATVFESELRYAETRIQADTFGDELKRTAKSTLMQQYQRTILGRSALTPQSATGKLFYATETVADDFLRWAWDKTHSFEPPQATAVAPNFDGIQNKLGTYNPFKTMEDMLENSGKVRTPPTFRGFTTKLNGFTTDMVLRILDFGMPIINYASLVSVTPAVIGALHRGPNETYEAWVGRIGIVGSPIDDNFAMPNTTRMVQEGLSMFFDPEMQRVRKMAAERGFTKQEVAERLNLWTSPHQGWVARNRDDIIKKLSWPTDASETMSRDIAFGMMYKIGKKTFQLDDEAAMIFGHVHANKIIGDFRPTNRPQMFQGAAGMPMGLFTTWAVNWLQRVFGDIEAGRLGATFWQVGMQQFMFGAESFPGVETMMDTYMTSYDGKRNVADSMDSMYGRTATDAFFHGTLSSLTGIAFQSRADVSLPAIMSGESPMTAIPSLSVMTTMVKGLSEGFKSIRQNGGFNPREMSEIMSLYSINGFSRNLFEALQGASVDRHGALINDSIRSWESAIPRFMELKSMRETRKAAELQRDRVQRQVQRGHIDRLSKQLRTAVRGGKVNAELLESALQDYVLAGGVSSDFKRYLREQVLASSFEKSSRLLLNALRVNDDQGKTMRLLRVTADEATPLTVFK